MKAFIYTLLDEHLKQQLKDALASELDLEFGDEKVDNSPREIEIVMGNPPVEWIEKQKARLLFWQLDSAGFDQYRSLSVPFAVANMGDHFAIPCAETIVAGILGFYRGIPQIVKLQEQKKWLGKELRPELGIASGKRVMILGYGSIGKHIKSMMEGMGCPVQTVARQNIDADIHGREEAIQQLSQTDIVINTLPGSARNFVSRDFLMAMKKGSLYANVGRAGTNDEETLIELLMNGQIAGAVLDVTSLEPIPPDSKLWDLHNVILTQHSGGGFTDEQEGKLNLFIRNVRKFLKGQPIENQVELSRGY